MNLIREIFFSSMVVDAAGIILIVAALPTVGWSWAVNHMAGPKVKMQRRVHESTSGVPVQWPVPVV